MTSFIVLLIMALPRGAEIDIKFFSISDSSAPTIVYVWVSSLLKSVIFTVAPNVIFELSSEEISMTSALLILFSSSEIMQIAIKANLVHLQYRIFKWGLSKRYRYLY